MAVNSVTASTDLATRLVQQQQKPAAQPQPAAPANPQAPANRPQPAAEVQTQTTQAPRPVVNSQGQTIGRNLSLKA